ncbi:MAG: beta-glucosidase, partial [Clostridiales bacterium]|nr:beta-glucosidase [Clostridiales bacterium]
YEQAPTANYNMHARETADIPPVPAYTGERGITLKDVKKGKHSVSEFVAQFSDKTLAALVRGEGMASSKAPMPGTTGCFGGVTAALRKAGLPIISLCDGPSGVRLECPVPATCIPSGTLLASAWAPELFDALFGGFADEMLMYKVDVILAPGINIHRHPLGGRNFEYFSEDPFLSGTNAAAVAKYFTEKGVYCTVKHFAVNSQENDRSAENEVLSERALREIYLRPFEMAVRSGYTYALMTSYNRINGVSASANYDLTTTILRGEWGYKGFVMTDWWAQMDDHGTFGTQNLAAMVRAQNDVFMLTSDALTYEDNIEESLSNGRLQSAQLRRCAENLIAFILKKPAVRRKDKVVDVNDPALQCLCESTVQEKHASVTVAREGMYVAEIALRLPGSVLNQYAFRVRVDDRQGITLSHNGSEGELTSLRFKVILHCASTLWFDDADVESVRILGNENGGPIA